MNRIGDPVTLYMVILSRVSHCHKWSVIWSIPETDEVNCFSKTRASLLDICDVLGVQWSQFAKYSKHLSRFAMKIAKLYLWSASWKRNNNNNRKPFSDKSGQKWLHWTLNPVLYNYHTHAPLKKTTRKINEIICTKIKTKS